MDEELERPEVRFAEARGGARLAYMRWGQGPDLVMIPPTAQNLEVAWEWPAVRAMLHRFGTFAHCLAFDKRGTGASDRGSVGGIDERVEDLRAVMDQADIERAHLLGASEGGPMTLLFAHTYPERVASVTLQGSGAFLHPPDIEDEARLAQVREGFRRYAGVWGTEESPVVDGFAPSLAHDQAFRDWHRRYERLAATRDSLLDLLELTLEMDVREILPEIDVPVLVLHRTGDRIVPVERARELADAIPGAVLFEQEGDDHFAYAGDVDGWMEELERFVTGSVTPVEPPPAERRIRIVTLGRFAVEVDGEEVPTSAWGTRRSRQLLKRLVVARGWPVRRDELFELLWPDETDRRKLGARLSVQLSTVRRVLGGGVVANRETVRLDLDEVTTDLEHLHRATDDAAVVAAYTGEFLPEDAYEDWTAPTRAEARTRFLTAARRLAEAQVARGAHDRAAETAALVLAEDAYDEPVHRLRVGALLASGRHGEAQRAHDHWRTSLAELGVEVPSLDDLAGR